ILFHVDLEPLLEEGAVEFRRGLLEGERGVDALFDALERWLSTERRDRRADPEDEERPQGVARDLPAEVARAPAHRPRSVQVLRIYDSDREQQAGGTPTHRFGAAHA